MEFRVSRWFDFNGGSGGTQRFVVVVWVFFEIQDSKDAKQVQRIEPALIPSRKEYFNSGLIQ